MRRKRGWMFREFAVPLLWTLVIFGACFALASACLAAGSARDRHLMSITSEDHGNTVLLRAVYLHEWGEKGAADYAAIVACAEELRAKKPAGTQYQLVRGFSDKRQSGAGGDYKPETDFWVVFIPPK